MIRLQPHQLTGKLDFIDHYISAKNAADGSKMDANANVTQKNIATMENELMKDFFVQINRAKVSQKIEALFGEGLAKEYLRQIESHEIYVHDETSLKPYCVSVTMYPFLRDGLTKTRRRIASTKTPCVILRIIYQLRLCHQLAICRRSGNGRILNLFRLLRT